MTGGYDTSYSFFLSLLFFRDLFRIQERDDALASAQQHASESESFKIKIREATIRAKTLKKDKFRIIAQKTIAAGRRDTALQVSGHRLPPPPPTPPPSPLCHLTPQHSQCDEGMLPCMLVSPTVSPPTHCIPPPNTTRHHQHYTTCPQRRQ